MKTISIYNQKGGCGKTTTVINLAGCLSERQFKVLVVDGDSQMNAGKTLLMERELNSSIGIDELIQGKKRIRDCVYPALIRKRMNGRPQDVGISVLTGSRFLSTVAVEDINQLKQCLLEVVNEYDYVLIDCPPYLSEFTLSILAASDYVLVPATVDKDSLDGFGELISCIHSLKENGVNPNLKILGVLMTMVSFRESFDRYVLDTCRELLGSDLLPVSIRRQTYAKQASHFGRPVCYYKKCGVAKDYECLTDTILQRIGGSV